MLADALVLEVIAWVEKNTKINVSDRGSAAVKVLKRLAGGAYGGHCYKLDTKQISVRDEALKSIHGKVPRREATIPETLVSPKHNKSEKKILTSVFETKH